MPLYIYRAKTHKHTKISGTFYAPNIDGLYAHLQSKHYILIHYRTQWAWKILNPVKDHDLKEWAHMMHFLIKNNITLKDTIYLVAQETSNPTLQETLYHLAYDLEQGSTIHDALQKHERILKPITIICLGMAEKTGNLVHSFERLHDYFTHHIKMKERLWSALRYPLCILVFLIGLLAAFHVMLIPELLDLFEDQNTMPPSLKGWLYVLDCMPFIIGFGIAMASGIWAIHHIFGAHKVFLYLKKRLGLWGLVTDIHVCRFLETMGLMLQAGIPLKHAFLHTQKILPNKGLNTHMKAIETTLDKGHSLSYGLGQIEWFDPMTIRLIKMGEKSGDIVPSIQQSAQLLYGRIIRRMDRITRLLQPLLLVMIALLLLWMISIFITPLYTQFLGDHHVG